jgi:hypothetical protein
MTIIRAIFLFLILIIAASVPARAADMAVKAPPPPAAPAYDWSGLYIGAHAGGAWQNTSFSDPGALSVLNNCCLLVGTVLSPGTANNASSAAGLVGIQGGWMYQVDWLSAPILTFQEHAWPEPAAMSSTVRPRSLVGRLANHTASKPIGRRPRPGRSASRATAG